MQDRRNTGRRPGTRRKGLRGLYQQRPLPAWLVALHHLLALGIALVLFALPHHVIPMHRASLGITSSRDAAPASVATTDALLQSEVQAAPADETQGGGESVPATAQTRVGDFSVKFADKFISGEPVRTDTSYVSENLNINITEYYVNKTRYYVADFYIRDITCLHRDFAKDSFGRNITENIRDVAFRNRNMLTINGDFYGIREGGVCVRNGELFYSGDVVREICVLYWDGSIECFPIGGFDCDREMGRGAYQIWNFGPAMLDENGVPRPEFDEIYHDIYGNQPRAALGYFEPGHYCFIAADGRSDDSRGLTMDQLGLVAQNLGCKQCYNMDGGQTAQLTFGVDLVNHPAGGGRNCSDYVSVVDQVG